MGAQNSGADAQRAQAQSDNARQAQVAETSANINNIFSSPQRAQQYADFYKSVLGNQTTQLNRQQGVNQRNLKFSTARSGLTGGSEDADTQGTLGQDYAQGLVQATGAAQSALGNLKANDQTSKNNLISLAQQGLDTTSASQQANTALAANAQQGLGNTAAQALGDVFGQTASIYNTQQQAAARRAGYNAPVGGYYAAPSSTSSSGALW